MTHLGERVSALVDGQLPPDAVERANAHLAGCPECREQAELERLTKQRLSSLQAATPSASLMASLLAIGGPEGPLPPREGHLPGTARPATVPLSSGPVRDGRRPAGAPSSSRPTAGPGRAPRRTNARRLTSAVLGALSVVGVGVVGLVAVGPQGGTVVPPVDSFVVQHAATTSQLPFGAGQTAWLTGGEGDR